MRIMVKRIFPLILMLFLFSSCESQFGTAVGAAFGNLFTGNGFGSSSGDEVYQKMKEETLASPSSMSPDSKCGNDPVDLGSILSNKNTKAMSNIKDKICSCQAWGTCDNKSCNCESLCPKNFEIFNRSGTATSDNADDSLSFTNSDDDFYKKYSDYNGFCWGHAIVTQRFNRLAKFYPASPKFSMDDDLVRRRELVGIIERLDNNEPVDIPGYKNLKEFSNDPEVKELLEENVKKNWAKNAMSSQGLSIISSGEPQGSDYYNKLFDDMQFRLDNHQMPAIVFNDRDNSSDAHTVLVSGSGKNPDGQRYLCIRDNNYTPEKSYDCKNKMLLGSDGTISYNGWAKKRIGKVELSYTENSNALEQIKNLRDKCRREKNCDAKAYDGGDHSI